MTQRSIPRGEGSPASGVGGLNAQGLEQTLARRLKSLRVLVEAQDSNTLFLRNVPVHEEFFSKPRTNLLLKRPGQGMPFLVCVDANLEYRGGDEALARTFARGYGRGGWKVLFLGQGGQAELDDVVESALALLGFDRRAPALRIPAGRAASGRLVGLARDLSHEARERTAAPCVSREEALSDVVAAVLEWQPRLALVVGPSGVGKTSLLRGLAEKLRIYRPEWQLLSVDLGRLMGGTLLHAERENLLLTALEDTEAGQVLALERLDLALGGLPHGALLLSQALDRGVKLVGTTLPEPLARFELAPLARRVQVIELGEPRPAEALSMLMAVRERIAAHHGVSMDDACVRAALEASLPLLGALPGKAVALLDAAGARTALAGEREVGSYQLYLAARGFSEQDDEGRRA